MKLTARLQGSRSKRQILSGTFMNYHSADLHLYKYYAPMLQVSAHTMVHQTNVEHIAIWCFRILQFGPLDTVL